jgi:hypothetical protein
MQKNNDLDKLFEAALRSDDDSVQLGRLPAKAPQKKPADGAQVFQKAAEPQASPSPFQKAEDVEVGNAPKANSQETESKSDLIDLSDSDEQAQKSLDGGLNEELEALIDQKHAKEKGRRRRGRVMLVVFLLAGFGGTAGWAVSNPERIERIKLIMAEIKSVANVTEMAAQYDESLEEVAKRGNQLDEATAMIGGDPEATGGEKDPGFEKEMGQMMGEEGGTTTAARDRKLREKFKSVQEKGSLK